MLVQIYLRSLDDNVLCVFVVVVLNEVLMYCRRENVCTPGFSMPGVKDTPSSSSW